MRLRINDDWKFFKGDIEKAETTDYNDSSWQKIKLPHDWSIEGPFSKENYIPAVMVANHLEARADSYLPKGIGWYRKEIDRNSFDSEGKTVYIEFEGVFRNSTLWVNGYKAGNHPWGYTGFFYNITPFLPPDNQIDVLAMQVDARDMEGWWYEGSGIYRNVWLILKEKLHIPPWGIFIFTPSVDIKSATVRFEITVVNHYEKQASFNIITEILSPDEKLIISDRTEHSLAPSLTDKVLLEYRVDNPLLWSTETPHLYKARTYILLGNKEVDVVETPFGIRFFEFTPDKGFFLNGKHLQIRGGCIHHDFGGLGCGLPDRAHEKTVEILKEMGCNMIRSAHNTASPSLMDVCDKNGILFWAEHRYLGPAETTAQPLREMIRRDRNHPCIVVWGLANTAGSPDGKLTEYLRTLNAIAKEEDPTRPTGVALEGNDGANENGFAMVTDVVGYNGGGMGIDDRDHRLFPERKILITEFASGRGTRGVYECRVVKDDKNNTIERYGDGRIMMHTGEYSTIFKLCEQHEKEWEHIMLRPWLAGGIMWSAIEYYGETKGWPFVTSEFGVIDICRFPKDTFYYYKKLWTSEPVLHIFPHWTWPGQEGKLIDIWCYTNCDTVDIYLNGKIQKGIPHFLQRGTSFPHLWWSIPYEPGVITAEGTINGKVVCHREIKTAGEPARVSAVPDRAIIKADNEDLSFVKISVEDEAGTVVPYADNEIEVNIKGNGRLIALCSGDPCNHQSPKGNRMKVFNGLCLAIIQSNGKPDTIECEILSPGLISNIAVIKSI
ncbi:MAG TPA: glycoside hydrolase family 2 TIM barrel-domain containing protein [bacterium]|nr:glycoside hydrolase family 2 TIM barrel-domain containing protein [bacterium]HPP29694.1 glycoside hydrolase family 2 TIM barrel-domain containing protein [bacterium]